MTRHYLSRPMNRSKKAWNSVPVRVLMYYLLKDKIKSTYFKSTRYAFMKGEIQLEICAWIYPYETLDLVERLLPFLVLYWQVFRNEYYLDFSSCHKMINFCALSGSWFGILAFLITLLKNVQIMFQFYHNSIRFLLKILHTKREYPYGDKVCRLGNNCHYWKK